MGDGPVPVRLQGVREEELKETKWYLLGLVTGLGIGVAAGWYWTWGQVFDDQERAR